MLEGKKAPAFTLVDQDEKKVALKDFAGKKVILFFYPKANTSGCTTEATDFQAELKQIQKTGTVVIGISRDKPEAQKKWAEKYGLDFPLLSDPEHKVHEKYGAWGEKVMYGKKSVGVIRTTVIVGENGKVEKVYSKVKAKGHVARLLKVVIPDYDPGSDEILKLIQDDRLREET